MLPLPRPADPRRGGFSLVDLLILVVVAVLVAAVVLPRRRVDGIVRAENRAIAQLATIVELLEVHQAEAKTDEDRDGVGEFSDLGRVLGRGRADFTRVEGTDTWERDGFYYTVLLAGPEKSPVPATSGMVVADFAEIAYLVVAWPARPGVSGMRAYARRPDGLLQHTIDGYPYGGADEPPLPPGDMIRGRRESPEAAPRQDSETWAPPIFSTR